MSVTRSLRSDRGFSLPEVLAASFIMTLVAVLSLQSIVSVKSSMGRSSQTFMVEEQHSLALLKSRKYSFLLSVIFDPAIPNVADLARCVENLKPLAVANCKVFDDPDYEAAPVYQENTSGGWTGTSTDDLASRHRSYALVRLGIPSAVAQSPTVQYITPAPPPALSASVMPSAVSSEIAVGNLHLDLENLSSNPNTPSSTGGLNWGLPGAGLTKPVSNLGVNCGGPNQPQCTISTTVTIQRVCSIASCSAVNVKVLTAPMNGAVFQARESITMIPNEMLLNDVPMTFNCLTAGNAGYGIDNVASTVICVPATVTLSQCGVNAVQLPRILTWNGGPADNCLQVASDCGQLGFSAAGLLSGQATCNTPPAPSGVVSFPQNCVGVWSTCSGNCAAGLFKSTFTQLVAASGGGMSCTGIYGVENEASVPCECSPGTTAGPTTTAPGPTTTTAASCAGGNCCISNCSGINPSCSPDNIGGGAPWNTADSAACFALAHSMANCACNDSFTGATTTTTTTAPTDPCTTGLCCYVAFNTNSSTSGPYHHGIDEGQTCTVHGHVQYDASDVSYYNCATAAEAATPGVYASYPVNCGTLATLPPPPDNSLHCYGAVTSFVGPVDPQTGHSVDAVCGGVVYSGGCSFPTMYQNGSSPTNGYPLCCYCGAGSTATSCLVNPLCH